MVGISMHYFFLFILSSYIPRLLPVSKCGIRLYLINHDPLFHILRLEDVLELALSARPTLPDYVAHDLD